ncbi:MAG TPA: DEAD/DEAH box helicase [Thermoanaerobaculia bacterium]
MSFTSFGLHPDLLRGVEDLDYAKPTPIQSDAIPPALDGRDVLGCAMTGSGKTAAFLLPILHHLMDRPRGATRALVLAPTRELAAQIHEHLQALARHTGLTGAAVFGGVAIGPQEQAFRDGVDVLIATPGRLLDHFQNDYAKLHELEVLVLDEADRMLDMGFLPDVRRVLQHIPPPRQTMLFSATMPPPIAELAREILRDPVTLNVERKAAPAEGVEQALYPVRDGLKPWLLVELLRRGDIKNVLVFTRTKHRANRLAEILEKEGIACDRLHSNRSQAQRTDALTRFKEGRSNVLVATDIAARGIDVEALSHVVNLDVPAVPEDYIHRVGRTARAELTGDAFTFYSPEEEPEVAAIERAIGRRLPRLVLDDFAYDAVPQERFEVPIAERIAAIRARKAEERARAREKAERKAQRQETQPQPRPQEKDRRRPEPREPREARPGNNGQQQRGPRPAPYADAQPYPPKPRRDKDRRKKRGGDQKPRPTGDPQFAPPSDREIQQKPEERAAQIASTFRPRFNRFK